MASDNPFADASSVGDQPASENAFSENPFAPPAVEELGRREMPMTDEVELARLALFAPHQTRQGILLIRCGILAGGVTIILTFVAAVLLAVLGLGQDSPVAFQVLSWCAGICVVSSYFVTLIGPWYSLGISQDSGAKMHVISAVVLYSLSTILILAGVALCIYTGTNTDLTFNFVLISVGVLWKFFGLKSYVKFLRLMTSCFRGNALPYRCKSLQVGLWFLIVGFAASLLYWFYQSVYMPELNDISRAVFVYSLFASIIVSVVVAAVYADVLKRIAKMLQPYSRNLSKKNAS